MSKTMRVAIAFMAIGIFIAISGPTRAAGREFENDGVSFSSKIKMLREAGQDMEIAFESRKGIFTLNHTTKDFEKIKAMLSMVKEREGSVKITIDSMSDQILSASEIKEPGKGKDKKTSPYNNW